MEIKRVEELKQFMSEWIKGMQKITPVTNVIIAIKSHFLQQSVKNYDFPNTVSQSRARSESDT